MGLWTPFIIFLAAAVAPASVLANVPTSSTTITADEAAARAATRTLDARTAQADLDAARAEESRVIVDYLPRLQGEASYRRLSDIRQPDFFGGGALVGTNQTQPPLTLDDLAPISGGGGFPVILDQYAFVGSLNIPLSKYIFELSDALSAAGSGVEAQALALDGARVTAASTARVAFYRFAAAAQQTVVFERRLAEAKERRRVSQSRYEAGQAAQTDVLEAQAALARAELNLARALTEVRIANEVLRQATLDPPNTVYRLEDGARFETTDLPQTAALSRLYEEALSTRVELKSVSRLIAALEANAHLEMARGLPILEAFGSVLSANPNPRFIPNQTEFNTTWEIGVRLQWSPNDLFSAFAQRDSARSETAKQQVQREALRLAVYRQLVEARQSIIEAKASLISARQGLEAAESAYEQRKLTYEQGASTLLDLLQSESALINAQLDDIRARIQARIAVVQLNNATGRDVATVLAKGPAGPTSSP